jgi:hypothetical protein
LVHLVHQDDGNRSRGETRRGIGTTEVEESAWITLLLDRASIGGIRTYGDITYLIA